MKIVCLLLRWLVAGLFIYAGVVKAFDPGTFAVDVYHYRILPAMAAVALALYLPYLEIFAALGSLTRRFRQGGLLILLSLMLVFMLALGIAWARGLDIACGCFGTRDATANYPWWMTRDALLLAALLWLKRMP